MQQKISSKRESKTFHKCCVEVDHFFYVRLKFDRLDHLSSILHSSFTADLLIIPFLLPSYCLNLELYTLRSEYSNPLSLLLWLVISLACSLKLLKLFTERGTVKTFLSLASVN